MLRPIVKRCLAVLLTGILGASVAHDAVAQDTGDRYALLIGGLGGSPERTETFQRYLFETYRALTQTFQIPSDHVVVLGEQTITALDFVDDVSTAENIQARFEALAAQAGAADHVYVVLFGHGGYDGQRARFNIPRRDLDDLEYAALLDGLNAGRVVFINTASASGPFAETLSGAGRVIITATRTGTQKIETRFPQYFVEALTNPAADGDKNGDLSVGELFAFAAGRTAQWFDDQGQIPTENALLEDTGDSQGARLEDLTESGEGNLAGVTYLHRRAALAASTEAPGAGVWLVEKEQIEQEIASLISRKSELGEDEYYAQLEDLFVRLARGNAAVEQSQQP